MMSSTPEQPAKPELIKTVELAAKLGVHVQVVRNKHAQGLIPRCACISTGTGLWWSRRLIDKWLADGCPLPDPTDNLRAKPR